MRECRRKQRGKRCHIRTSELSMAWCDVERAPNQGTKPPTPTATDNCVLIIKQASICSNAFVYVRGVTSKSSRLGQSGSWLCGLHFHYKIVSTPGSWTSSLPPLAANLSIGPPQDHELASDGRVALTWLFPLQHDVNIMQQVDHR